MRTSRTARPALARRRSWLEGLALAGLMAAGASTAWAQKPAPTGHSLSFVFPRDKSLNPILRLIGNLAAYNTEEANLATEETVSRSLLISHWRRLDTIAASLEQLQARGRLGTLERSRWEALRHEIAALYQATPEIVDVAANPVDAGLRAADQRRKQNLIRIALIANQAFDLGIREVFGIRLDALTS
jgi:hypothetical protein